jgi:hypothetical protein
MLLFLWPFWLVGILLSIFGFIRLIRNPPQSRRSKITGECMLIFGGFLIGFILLSPFIYLMLWG